MNEPTKKSTGKSASSNKKTASTSGKEDAATPIEPDSVEHPTNDTAHEAQEATPCSEPSEHTELVVSHSGANDGHNKPDQNKLQKILKNHVVLTGAAGLIPTPIVDLASITAIQANMIKEISHQFGVEFKDNLCRNSIGALITGTGIVPFGTSLMKTIPILGTLGGMLTMPIIASASTYALGKVFIEHFENGGTLLDFSSETVKAQFKKEYQEGKKFAANLKDEILRTHKRKKS